MLGLRNKTARAARRGGLLAACIAGALCVAAIGAGSAAAAPHCTGGKITGEGSSLQKVANQSVWAPTFNEKICPTAPQPAVTYVSSSSGEGMTKWNYLGTTGKIDITRAFIGTDEPPTAAQITNILSAKVGTETLKERGANLAVIPVAQTAISVPANPPAGCTVNNITNEDLEKVFRGTLLNWSELITASGTCSSPITRIVRNSNSGTTFQFKNYLLTSNKGTLPCSGGKTWTTLENLVWPENSAGCSTPTLSPLIHSGISGGGGLVEEVNAHEGAIGYAALPDAESKGAKAILNVQNNGKGQTNIEDITFGNPNNGGEANCTAISYRVPVDGRKTETSTALNVDWSTTFGARPSVGEGYPLCTLTFDLAFNGYQKAGFASQKGEVTVKDYIAEYLLNGGQTDLAASGKWYAALPFTSGSETNVRGAARKAAEKIVW